MPRGSFAAALLKGKSDVKDEHTSDVKDEHTSDVKDEHAPLDAKERAELQLLRKRVAALSKRVTTLEVQLKAHGLQPLPGEDGLPDEALKPGPEMMDARLGQLLSRLGLDCYVDIFLRFGFCDLDRVRGMQETEMKTLGLLPGDALKLRLKIEENMSTSGETAERQHEPGVYRCVHSPLVAIRAAPSRHAKILQSLHHGELIRISQIVPPCWGRVDESEIWARWTKIWPVKPPVVLPAGKDDQEEQEEQASEPPGQAFVLLDGAEAGISGPLLTRLASGEEEAVTWPFSEALEVRCEELNAALARRQPAASAALREKFVETARSFIGKPYARCYHDPSDARCLPGSELPASTSFVNNTQLIEHAIDKLKEGFGFTLHPNCRPAHLYRMLRSDLTEFGDLEPGDLIFYQTFDRKSGQTSVIHVEIFAGGAASLGSLPWSASERTGGKDGVQLFENYDMEELEGLPITGLRFCSIRPWLEANVCSFAHGQHARQALASAAN